MAPIIADFPNTNFYDNKIKSEATLKNSTGPKGFDWPVSDKPVAFVDCQSSEEKLTYDQSFENETEVRIVYEIVNNLMNLGSITPKQIGIITPYSAQVKKLTRYFDERGGLTQHNDRYHKLSINTVDGFQGREKDIIIYSAVRSNKSGNVGFLRDWRRMNVSLTRAKSAMILLGDEQTLKHESNWSKWLQWAESNQLIVRNYRIPDYIPPFSNQKQANKRRKTEK